MKIKILQHFETSDGRRVYRFGNLLVGKTLDLETCEIGNLQVEYRIPFEIEKDGKMEIELRIVRTPTLIMLKDSETFRKKIPDLVKMGLIEIVPDDAQS